MALARDVTGDFQFARAAVNYIWAQFFGRGIVDPPDTFDPARLDPDNPPPAPWTLQPSNADAAERAGAALRRQRLQPEGADARDRELATRTSSPAATTARGTPRGSRYFARKFVRRLWAEEIHDAMVQSSGTLPSYTHHRLHRPGLRQAQLRHAIARRGGRPERRRPRRTSSTASCAAIATTSRASSDGSILQALNLMNNNFVEQRLACHRRRRPAS